MIDGRVSRKWMIPHLFCEHDRGETKYVPLKAGEAGREGKKKKYCLYDTK